MAVSLAVAEQRAREAMRVYRVRVAMRLGEPARWTTMLAPGCDPEEARRRAETQFGTERLLEIQEHRP